MERIDRLKKIASYFEPQVIFSTGSEKNQYLEVVVESGKLVLNTRFGNFSEGNLAVVFDKAFYHLKFRKKQFNNILLLGLGAGSVVKLLRNKYHQTAPIHAVDYDEEVIKIGKQFFGLDTYVDLKISCSDAIEFLEKNTEVFDLIIIDLFQELDVPNIFHQPHFIELAKARLAPNGTILFNKVTMNPEQMSQLSTLKSSLAQPENLSDLVFLEFNHILVWENKPNN